MQDLLTRYPALSVEIGAAYVLVAALAARLLLRRFGIPSILTLLAFGLASGPSGFDFMHLNLTQPATRALLSLAVVLVLFEATLRMELHGLPKRVVAGLALLGPAAVLLIVPTVGHGLGLSWVVATMLATICVVTGPTVTGPLLARLRLRLQLSHLLETEGLALDALGVIVAAAYFASFTTRPGGPESTLWHAFLRVGTGIAIGLCAGFLGRRVMPLIARMPSDVSKVSLLLLGVGTYALAEAASHETGLAAVVTCGLMLDFSKLPHEHLLRSFKEDLSMLALSTVFVLLASQIEITALGPLVGVGAAITAVLVAIRIATVAIATIRSSYSLRERVFMMTVFPRGIVAVSLATYYATQLPAWDIRGGGVLAGTAFLVIIFTVLISSGASLICAKAFRLTMPSVVVIGISSRTVDLARRLAGMGYLVRLTDDEERRIAFGRAHDLECEYTESAARVYEIVAANRARIAILARPHRWPALRSQDLPKGVSAFSLGEDRAGWRTMPDDFSEDLQALLA